MTSKRSWVMVMVSVVAGCHASDTVERPVIDATVDAAVGIVVDAPPDDDLDSGVDATGTDADIDAVARVGQFRTVGALAQARFDHAAALLADGRVLVAGGFVYSGPSPTTSAETWNPAFGTWSATGAMVAGRDGPSAVTLANGKVLVSGGFGTSGALASTELYDPATGTFALTGSMGVGRSRAASTLLPDGAVLVSGGTTFYKTLEQYDVATGTWSNTGQFPEARSGHSASLLPAGTVLLAGGGAGPLASAVIYDPACAAASLSPTGASYTEAGGTGTIDVAQAPGCPWTVTGLPAWVTVTSGSSGDGNGTVAYSVAANTGTARSATLNIAGKSFAVSQAASPCTIPATISPSSQSVAATGGSGSVAVTHQPGCTWSATGAPSWVTLTSGSTGSGSGTVAFTVAANTGTARSATLVIANNNFALSQAAAPAGGCDFVGTVNSPGTYSGSLATTDCKAGARGTTYYTDRYQFTASPGQQVAFLLTAGFDTYLYLRNPAGTVIASNDDGGGGTNSRIPAYSGAFTIPAGSTGTYVIEVTSYSSNVTGAYTLQRIQ